MAPRYMGIDPGLTGAIAVLEKIEEQIHLAVFDMPLIDYKRDSGKRFRAVDPHGLKRIFDELTFIRPVAECAIEEVSSSSQMGNVSAFSFGRSYGAALTALAFAEISTTPVRPTVWKRTLRCPRDKSAARARASELMPTAAHCWSNVGHDGRAEAAMLAYYLATGGR